MTAVITNQSGSFIHEWSPPDVSTYAIQALWDGDSAIVDSGKEKPLRSRI
ncbi:MAG: hypothetical protein JSV57_05860 [Candidatus Bathyarchaeota archaeon]|nr:MAG: hypothetical protein JSV57_05860 [Candidatus Bathyarchaeota archaeon]